MLYELIVLGEPTPNQLAELKQNVSEAVSHFGLTLNVEVGWSEGISNHQTRQQTCRAAVFFASEATDIFSPVILKKLILDCIPILPVSSRNEKVEETLPPLLHAFNCLDYETCGTQRIANALLECVGLLPRKRRVFLSYRRHEATQAALQLFDDLSARHYDVFLDTHGIPPAEDFQATLWHRLCDSDILVMLDTASYFSSRWTSAEFGRALAKGILVLRVGWPDVEPSNRTATAKSIQVDSCDLDTKSGQLSSTALQRISVAIEQERSKSVAVRHLNLVSKIRESVIKIGGSYLGIDGNRIAYAVLPDGKQVAISPVIGVPSAVNLHEASKNQTGACVAVVYEHTGLHKEWIGHIDWLGDQIRCTRWLRAESLAWDFADLEV